MEKAANGGPAAKAPKIDRQSFLRKLFEILMTEAVEAGTNVEK